MHCVQAYFLINQQLGIPPPGLVFQPRGSGFCDVKPRGPQGPVYTGPVNQRCYQDQGVGDQDQTKTRQAETETETKTREAETKTKTKTSKSGLDRSRDQDQVSRYVRNVVV